MRSGTGASTKSSFQKAGSIFSSRKSTGSDSSVPNHSVEQEFPTYNLDQDDLWEWLDTHFPESKPIEVKVRSCSVPILRAHAY